MLSGYLLEKKIKEFEKTDHKFKQQKLWEKWKTKNTNSWVQNYKHRIEKFISDVFFWVFTIKKTEENQVKYSKVLPAQKELNFCTPQNINYQKFDQSPFLFRPFKTEKERILVSF